MNTIYLNGIYQAKTSELINKEEVYKLNKEDLLVYLKNHNYGQGSNYEAIDNVLSHEQKNIRKELNELTGSTLLGDIFFLNDDLVNIKIAYKSIFANIQAENFSVISRFSEHDLTEFFKNNNDTFIDTKDLPLLLKIKNINFDSLKDSLEFIEITYINYIYELINLKLPNLKEYFLTKNFNQNLLTFIKFKKRSNNDFDKILLPQNNFDKAYWLELFELNNDQIIEKLNGTYYGKLSNPLEEFFRTNKTNELLKTLNLVLTDKIQILSYDLKSLAPVFNYLHLKQNEISYLREVYYGDK